MLSAYPKGTLIAIGTHGFTHKLENRKIFRVQVAIVVDVLHPSGIIKEGKLDQERYYGDEGKMYLDIDYSNHGNSKMHPNVPHQHKLTYDDNGKMHRDSSDTEVK